MGIEIKLDGKSVEDILSNHVFEVFGKLFGVEKKEELEIKIEASYNEIKGMVITKAEKPEDSKDDQ